MQFRDTVKDYFSYINDLSNKGPFEGYVKVTETPSWLIFVSGLLRDR